MTITNKSLAQVTTKENIDFLKNNLEYIWLLEGLLIKSFYLG
jgi:hypothetical protein